VTGAGIPEDAFVKAKGGRRPPFALTHLSFVYRTPRRRPATFMPTPRSRRRAPIAAMSASESPVNGRCAAAAATPSTFELPFDPPASVPATPAVVVVGDAAVVVGVVVVVVVVSVGVVVLVVPGVVGPDVVVGDVVVTGGGVVPHAVVPPNAHRTATPPGGWKSVS
jgi:hypothetical protein